MIVFFGENLTRWINTGKQVFVRQFALSPSFLRKQEPIATDANCHSKTNGYRLKSRGRGVWVPAFQAV
jgi:hypothetical protein